MRILNIPVTPAELGRWRGHLAPPRQPFFLSRADAERLDLPATPRSLLQLTPEERDTFTLWAVDQAADQVTWLSPAQWAALPPAGRRELLRLQVRAGRGNVPLGRHFADLLPSLAPGRFLWQRDHLTPAVLARLVSRAGVACQREAVPPAVWEAARPLLPCARELAGTFPQGSAGNCFGAVMGAAGLNGAEHEWMQRDPFEAFLRERARRGGQDEQPGTLLVWRSERGVEHAAVTLGGGWAFQKAAQTWWTPRVVLPVAEVKRTNRVRGWRLERWQLRPG